MRRPSRRRADREIQPCRSLLPIVVRLFYHALYDRVMAAPTSPEEVRRFWFADTTGDSKAAEARNDVWFGTSAQFDEECRRRFEPMIAAAARGELASWESAPRSCV